MFTAQRVVDDLKAQVTGFIPTDDTRLDNDNLYFILSYCNAFVQDKRLSQDAIAMGSLSGVNPDPSIYREYEILVDPATNQAEMPVNVMSLPMDRGFVALYTLEPRTNQYTPIRITTPNQAFIDQGMYWEDAKCVYFGNTLRFISPSYIPKVYALLVTNELPRKSDGTPDKNAFFPAPDSLIAPIMDMAIRMLRTGQAIPADYVNDARQP